VISHIRVAGIGMGKEGNDLLIKAVKEWAEKEKSRNPSFSLVVGRKAFTIDEIVDHIEKNTEEGKMLKTLILKTATDLFFRYNP